MACTPMKSISFRNYGFSASLLISAFGLLQSVNLPAMFIFPANQDGLIKWMNQLNRAWSGTFLYARTTEPTFIRIKHNWRLALMRIWHQQIATTNINATITANAYSRIKFNYSVRQWRVWQHIYLIFQLGFPPYYF